MSYECVKIRVCMHWMLYDFTLYDRASKKYNNLRSSSFKIKSA
jgi:hypothetical protein